MRASCKSGSFCVHDKVCFVWKFSETLSLFTQTISALCYCTVYSVLLWTWQCVCYSYCRQLNAVSFSTDTSCCTVQIHIQSADWVLFRYTAGIFSVLLWMWQCVWCSYCRQLNAVSFSTETSCCTVQIHIQSALLVPFSYSAGIFIVLLWMWQCVCCSYCCQLNAVSFSTETSCCTVQIHIQCADWVLFRYTAGNF